MRTKLTHYPIISVGSKDESPIHDRWLVTKGGGLILGTSLNSIGSGKTSDMVEMTVEEAERHELEIDRYLRRERTEHNGERVKLVTFWL